MSESPYSDIIDAPRWNPKHHARMPLADRAVQFAPFAALVGFEEVIEDVQARHVSGFERQPRNLDDGVYEF